MREVAELAGVGTMTVSRVINGSSQVTEETRQRVLKAIKALNYHPNEVARSLREQRSRQIGIIVPNLLDPFFAICAQAVSLVAREHRYSVNIAMSYEDPEVEYKEAVLMLRRHLDGLIVIPAAGAGTHFGKPEFGAIPIVTLDRPLTGGKFDSVEVQNRTGASMAVEHLIGRGHTRIAYLGLSPHLYTIRARFQGYRQAMSQAGLLPDAHYGNETPQEMLVTLRRLLQKEGPTALFCSNNLMTRNTLHALSELKARIPETVALVGFDDFETAHLLRPSITVVRQPTEDMGRIGAHLLFSRLKPNDRPAPRKKIVLPVKLIVRDSS